jgi:hypothetical protein
MAFEVPVLIIIYKRAETTAKVLKALELVKPTHIYVAANAPNPDNAADPAKVNEVRALFDAISWPCTVTKLFRTEHLSAKNSISSAITWFFQLVEEGIILEDDCEVNESFFRLASECLDKYRNIPEVMQINASNFQFGQNRGNADYYFSRYNHIWGWASWRRAWQHFKLHPADLKQNEVYAGIDAMFTRPQDRSYWRAMYQYAMSGRIDTWDYQWMFSFWAARGKAITPNQNLVSNLGFGADATNSITTDDRVANLPKRELHNPLQHPSQIEFNDEADNYTSDEFFGISKSYKTGHLKIKVATLLPVSFKKRLKKMLLKMNK